MLKRTAMFLLSLVVGYAVMIALIFCSQDLLFGLVTYHGTPMPQLLIAGVLTTISAGIGGAIAAWIFGRPFFPPALAMCGLVLLESTYMISSGQMPGPVWFDWMASFSLVVGICTGAFVVKRLKRPSVIASPATSG